MNDRQCLAFSKAFYWHVMENPGCYGAAFRMASAQVDAELAAWRLPSQASDAARPCLLWDDRKSPAVDGAWVSKQRSALGRSVWRDCELREFADEEEERKDEEEEEGKETSSAARQESSSTVSEDRGGGGGGRLSEMGSGEGVDVEEGVGGEDVDDVTRMANNPKGQAELAGFKSLNFKLDRAEEGIRLYRAGELDGTTVQEYGLEEERQYPLREKGKLIPGKFLLMYQKQAKSFTLNPQP